MDLCTQGYFFTDQFICEKSNEKIVFRVPSGFHINIDKKILMAKFEDIRDIDYGIWSNGDQDITIWLKQYQLHESGLYMVYK